MHHVAIMKRSWGLIPKIVSGEKTVESRWYMTRRVPWGAASRGDTIFFKDTGGPVWAEARVSRVSQIELSGLGEIQALVDRYGKDLCLVNTVPETWGKVPRYCILLFLGRVKKIARPFHIRKEGFGAPAAWITVSDISEIMR